MNSSKKPQRSLWVLEEEAPPRSVASDTRATVDSMMERLKAKARAHAVLQKKYAQSLAQAQKTNVKAEKTSAEDLKWGTESVSVRITSQEGQPICE